MVWWFTSTRHEQSITPAVRAWLKGSLLDRWIKITTIGFPWFLFWLIVAAVSDAGAGLLFVIAPLPWYFWILDAIVDYFHVRGDLAKLHARDDVILATRAEYVGGHPALPHGRFAYLTLGGDQEDPFLTIVFPALTGDGDRFDIPLLDINKATEAKERGDSLADTLLATLSEKPGKLFSQEQVTLNVEYQGPAGRKHKVELTNFVGGPDEIRNWRNYLVCTQAEADTGTRPFGPWKGLKPRPVAEEASSDDGSRDGSKVPPARRAFERR